jgi:hypothetical protein
MPDEFDEIRWTETPRMRCLAFGPKVYFKRELLSTIKFAIGFGLFFFLVAVRHQQVWHARGPQGVIIGTAFGFFCRLLIGIMPAFVNLNQTTLSYSGGSTRIFLIAACESFTITPTRGLIRFEFDSPRGRRGGLEHIVIAAPASAFPYLAAVGTGATSDSKTSPSATGGEPAAASVPQLDYEPKRVNPYLGALFFMGILWVGVGVMMAASPIAGYFLFEVPLSLVPIGLAIAGPAGIVLILIGRYCIRAGVPWFRQGIERAQRTKTIK